MSEPLQPRTAPRRTDVAERARLDRRLFDRRDRGDPRARDELIERFLPLARSIALRYDKRGESMEDLMQVASMALVKAVDRFDPERGTAFSSYAVPTIAGEIKRYFRDRTWAIRPPRDLQELVLRIDRVAERLGTKLNRAPTVGELAEAVGECDELVLEALQARGVYSAISLHAARGGPDDATILQDELGELDGGFEVAESRAVVARLMRGVSRRERMVLRLRFEMDLTQAEIGALLGVSQMQVSRILRQALERLREVAESDSGAVATVVGGS
jgi:RNA polymerase sigma-B factor